MDGEGIYSSSIQMPSLLLDYLFTGCAVIVALRWMACDWVREVE